MKRFACLCGGLAVLTMVQSAAAQVLTTNSGLAVWYDTRTNTLPAAKNHPVNQSIDVPGTPYTNGVAFADGAGKNAVSDIPADNLGGPGDSPGPLC